MKFDLPSGPCRKILDLCKDMEKRIQELISFTQL